MEKAAKAYVSVLAAFMEDGRLIPRRIRWEDGRLYDIERVTDIRPAPSLKAGGQGDRYTVQISGKKTYLFFERSINVSDSRLGRWFVERK